jgi:hypothetical protein
MASEVVVSKAAGEILIDYIMQTPKAAATLIISCISGHLWAYVIAVFIRNNSKGNKFLSTNTGKTALGFIWFTLIMAILYWFKFDDFSYEYEKILAIVIPSLVFGLVIQLFVFIMFIIFGDKK